MAILARLTVSKVRTATQVNRGASRDEHRDQQQHRPRIVEKRSEDTNRRGTCECCSPTGVVIDRGEHAVTALDPECNRKRGDQRGHFLGRFGDAGLTGVLILRWEGETACVDSFLMSCRVIGRGIEGSIWKPVLALARAKGCRKLEADFLPTAKNAQVSSYFDDLGLPRIEETSEGARHYRILTNLFVPPQTPWIEVANAE